MYHAWLFAQSNNEKGGGFALGGALGGAIIGGAVGLVVGVVMVVVKALKPKPPAKDDDHIDGEPK